MNKLNHIAFIMDGNGRWGKKKRKGRNYGHIKGVETVKKIESKYSGIKQHISVSILGCIVNGPGEAKHVDIGVTGGGKNNHQIYLNGEKSFISKNQDLTKVISKLIEEKLKNEK